TTLSISWSCLRFRRPGKEGAAAGRNGQPGADARGVPRRAPRTRVFSAARSRGCSALGAGSRFGPAAGMAGCTVQNAKAVRAARPPTNDAARNHGRARARLCMLAARRTHRHPMLEARALNPLALMGLGLLLGLRHAADPDHVVAVSAIAARTRRVLPATSL